MSKYIDADALIEKMPTVMDMQDTYLPIHFKEWLIDEAPSIDIVRCKECKHNYNTAINHGKMNPRCDFMDVKLKPADFCSYGERNDNEF